MSSIELGNRTYDHLFNLNDINFTRHNSSIHPRLVTDPADITLWFIIFVGFCFVGALQNFSMVVVVWTNPTLRQGCGALLIHLSLTQALLFAIHYPIYAVLTLVKHLVKWDIPQHWCPYVVMPQTLFSFVTNWTDVCLALNRLMAICFPHGYQSCYRNHKKFSTIMILAAVWMFNICLALPPCFGIGGIYLTSKIGSCQWFPNDWLISTTRSALGVQFPLTLAGCFYAVVLLKAAFSRVKNRAAIHDHQQTRDMHIMKKRMAMVLILFISFLVYVSCYLPASIVGAYFQPLLITTPVLYLWLRTVFLGGAAIAPVRPSSTIKVTNVRCQDSRMNPIVYQIAREKFICFYNSQM